MPKQLKEFAHPEFLAEADSYQQIRDCFVGSRAIKAAGTKYLPMLGGQSISDYELYKTRALFFPITGKTVSTLLGFATSRDPELNYAQEMQPYFVDDSRPYQFTEFYVKLLQENLLMGRVGVLIDAPATGAPRPNLLPYIAESIINWDADDNGLLRWVLLREPYYEVDPADPFKISSKIRYRWCGLVNGVYTVRIYDEDLKPVSADIVPLFRRKSINYVPFVVIGSSGVHLEIDRPPMLDIATINISHYMSSADLEWGRHFVGLPTPVIIGADANTSLKIGGTAAWVLPNEGSDAKYLEFVGQGLQSLENALQEKIGLMATMSARLVDTSTKGSEAAETVRMRYMSETASLRHVINSTEAGLNTIYAIIAEMLGTENPKIKLNRELLGARLTAGELRELFAAYFQGSISKETLIFNLRRSDLLDPTRSDEEEMSAILDPQQMLERQQESKESKEPEETQSTE